MLRAVLKKTPNKQKETTDTPFPLPTKPREEARIEAWLVVPTLLDPLPVR